MTLEYLPNIGFKINSTLFKWSEPREFVRSKFENQHHVDDKVIDLGENQTITQRRDIYKNFNGNNHFFLNYDEEDKLIELEIHSGVKIIVKNIELNFEVDIAQLVNQLSSAGENFSTLEEEGSYLFQALKVNIANSESMGGEGNGLYYFYSAKNIDHLID